MQIQTSIEAIEAIVAGVEFQFGYKCLDQKENRDPVIQKLLDEVSKLRSDASTKFYKAEANERAIQEILAVVVDGRLNEDELQEFLDEEVIDVASQGGCDTNNGGQEEQIRYLVEELGGKEVKENLKKAFPDEDFDFQD